MRIWLVDDDAINQRAAPDTGVAQPVREGGRKVPRFGELQHQVQQDVAILLE